MPKDGYSESDIKVFEGLDVIRKRPGMYVGGTDSNALTHLLWEIIDNAVDEAAEGHAKNIEVVAHADGSWSVTDDGRGIPIGKHEGGKQSTVEVVFTKLHAGGKFGSSSYAAAGGLHGVGAAAVTALSRMVRVEISKRTAVHRLDLVDQVAGQYDDTTAKFSPGHSMKRVGKPVAGRSGTMVRFWPDMEIFVDGARFDWDQVADRLRRTAWLVKGTTLTLTDESGEHETVTALAKRGLLDALDTLGGMAEFIGNPISFVGDHSFPERVPGPDGKKVIEVIRPCHVEVAMQWTKAHRQEIISSFVNTIPTPDGGSHLEGFIDGLSREVRLQLQRASLRKLSKYKDTTIQREDCLSGLVAIVRIVLPEPQFDGQTKRRLGTPAAEKIVKSTVRTALSDWFQAKTKGAYKHHIRAVFDHVADAVIDRHRAAEDAAARRKTRKASNGSLPAKLADCRHHPQGELLIVEGDSAAGPAKRARDIGWQAVLPLRGKVINAARNDAKKVFENEEAAALIAAMGAGSGKGFDLEQARYERLVLLADADVDGGHIRALLLTLLWHQMRPLLEAGRVFSAEPPTHAVTIVSSNEKKFVMDSELESVTKDIQSRGRKFRVTRFKGLGEMNDDELAATTLAPSTRRLRRISVEDAEASAAAVEVMMGGDSNARREFVVECSAEYGEELHV